MTSCAPATSSAATTTGACGWLRPALGASGGHALAERLAAAVAAVATVRGAALTVSIGLAASPADGTNREALTARADEALYAARAAGVAIRY